MMEESGEKVTETIDVADVGMLEMVQNVPLLIELLREGTKFDHCKKIIVENLPTGLEYIWNAIITAVPGVRQKNIEFKYRQYN